MKKFAGIEGGGTKFNVGIGNEKGEILDKVRIPTTSPEETLAKVVDYLKQHQFESIGVGVFGPVELDKTSSDYGKILNTPKTAWKFFNIYQALKTHFNCPVIIEHDVNAALLAELKWGSAKNMTNAIYYTVGTGIGAGLWLDNRFYHGRLHSEAGHMHLPKHPDDPGKGGGCPFHGESCLEGLVSGPAIEKRYGIKAEDIPDDSPIWDFVAYYLALACANTMFCFAPDRIVMGGGVMNKEFLFPKIRKEYLRILSGYDQKPVFVDTDNYIVHAALKNDPGLIGSFALGFV